MAWYDAISDFGRGVVKTATLGAVDLGADEKKQKEAEAMNAAARGGMQSTSDSAQQFANQSQGEYGSLGNESNAARGMLWDQATGNKSYSSEALRQGMQQNLAAQRSMAASMGGPMAARNAMNNMSRSAYGLSGQQALAGIQERNAAQQALANAIMQQRQQAQNATMGSRNTALSGYGGMVNQQGDRSSIDRAAPVLSGIAGVAGAYSAGKGK